MPDGEGAMDYPVTWREFTAIIDGLKVRAKGGSYDGPQAHWVNPIWDDVLKTATTKGSAKSRLSSLNAFANREDE